METKPEDIYELFVHEKGKSIFGETDRMVPHTEFVNSKIPILKAFWEDNDIQEITVVSTNIGMVKTFSKSYKQELKDTKPK